MLYLIGINHKTADLETREKLWLSDEEIRNVLPGLHADFFEECFLVSTCNRTELYGVPSSTQSFDTDEEYLKTIEHRLITAKNPGLSLSSSHFYKLKDNEAARHLLEVSTGLDSMVVGDVQILNQVRQHYDIAAGLKTTGPVLNKLLHVAIHAGKRTKSETDISKGAVSVSYAAVDLAAKIFYNLNEKSALLIGAGETGELTARHLASRGIGKLYITNRTFQKASELSGELNATAIPFENFTEHLSSADVIISSITSPEYVITREQLEKVISKRKHAPLLIIDIGVPRNVDPAANNIDNIFLHDLDTLSRIVQQSLQKRQNCIPDVNAIITKELGEFERWCKSHSVAPIVDELKMLYENIRKEELIQHFHKFAPEDKELVEHVTRRIVHRLIQLPASELRNGKDDSKEHKEEKLKMLRKLFGIHGTMAD